MTPPQKQAIKFLPYTPIGAHTALSLSTIQSITVLDGATAVMLQADGGNIRFSIDGTAVVAGTTGFLLINGSGPMIIDMPTGAVLKVVSVSGTVRLQYQFLG